MSDEIGVTTDVLVVLSEASTLVSHFSAISKVLDIISPFISVLPFVGAALALVKNLLPDAKHAEILQEFAKLSSKIDQVRDDIKELEMTMKWECVKLQYGDVVNRVTLGMNYCLEIGNAKDESSKTRYEDRLKELCSNQEFTLALNALMDGITGNGLFRSSILDELYQKTQGNRPKISALASRLLQLVCGGLMVNATYEAAMRGKEGAREMTKSYEKELFQVKEKIESVLHKCKEKFEEHMLSDLNHILDRGGSNEALLNDLLALMHDKYDWQEHFCLVYDDLWGYFDHCFNGSRVESLHHNNKKCGIVFYRTAGEPSWFSDRYNEAYKIVDDAYCYNAEEGYNNIETKLAERGIGWTGCVVVKRRANVRYGGNFSTAIVNTVGDNAHAILLLQ